MEWVLITLFSFAWFQGFCCFCKSTNYEAKSSWFSNARRHSFVCKDIGIKAPIPVISTKLKGMLARTEVLSYIWKFIDSQLSIKMSIQSQSLASPQIPLLMADSSSGANQTHSHIKSPCMLYVAFISGHEMHTSVPNALRVLCSVLSL